MIYSRTLLFIHPIYDSLYVLIPKSQTIPSLLQKTINKNVYETSRQSRFDARYWILGAGALGRHREMVRGGRREEGSGWGTHVYLWRIHVDTWQNQYNIVKLKKKKECIYSKRKNRESACCYFGMSPFL